MQNANTVRDIDPAVLPLSDYGSREWAERILMEELEAGIKSAEECGWVSQEEVEREFGLI
jgi:hypothetical protein